MLFTLNGSQEELAVPCSLAELLKTKNLDPASIIVEYNGELVKEPQWKTIVLKEQDCIEILRFVGGG